MRLTDCPTPRIHPVNPVLLAPTRNLLHLLAPTAHLEPMHSLDIQPA